MREAADLACRTNARFVAYEICSDPTGYQAELYRFWHGHLAGLIAGARPDTDAHFLAHALQASLRGDLVHHLIANDGMSPERIRDSVVALARAVLTGPPSTRPGSVSAAS